MHETSIIDVGWFLFLSFAGLALLVYAVGTTCKKCKTKRAP